MELQFQSSDCRCLRAAVREVRNAELTQEIRLSDGMPDIGRVLASWGQPILRSKEWQGDMITVAGGIMAWILYAPEDGTAPRCMETWIPFQLKWELERSESEGTIRVCPLVRFVDSRSISARKMMIRAGVAAMAEAMTPEQIQTFHPGELPEDIQLLKNTYPVRIPKEAGEKTFLIDEQLQLPEGTAEPERLLAYTITPQVQEKRVAGDKVTLRGTGRIHIVYRCSEGIVHAADMEIPFAQFAQLEDSYGAEAQTEIMVGTTSLELLQNEGSLLRIKCGLVAQYLITDRQLMEIVEDAYSPRRNVEMKLEELNLPAVLDQRTELIQTQQKLPGVEGNVADAIFLPDFPRQSRMGDKITLDMPGQFQVLYYTEDGSLQSSTARWENSMQIMADTDSCMSYQVQPCGAVQTTTAAEELNLNGQMKLELQAQTKTGIRMVTALEIGQQQEPDPDRPSLILCRREDQTLWEIAKRCGATVEEIKRINNPDNLSDPERVLLIPVC